jgi:hypothetical protein
VKKPHLDYIYTVVMFIAGLFLLIFGAFAAKPIIFMLPFLHLQPKALLREFPQF